MIKVTIIMPSLNVVNYIDECIQSVINQTLKEVQIICVDAGSTDGTYERLMNYSRRDSRIRVITSNIKSYGKQINMGIEQAKGKYIGIVETDDFIASNMFEELYELAEKNKLDFIKGDYEDVYSNADGTYTMNPVRMFSGQLTDYYNNILSPINMPVLHELGLNIWRGIYKRDFLIKNNIFLNETKGAAFQDTAFYHQVILKSHRAMFVEKPYYKYRKDRIESSFRNPNTLVYTYNEYKYLTDNYEHDSNINQYHWHYIYVKMFREYVQHVKNYIIAHNYENEKLEDISDKISWFDNKIEKLLSDKIINNFDFSEDTWNDYMLLRDSVYKFSELLRIRVKLKEELNESFWQGLEGKNLFIFGTGAYGKKVSDLLCKHGYDVFAYCDNNKDINEFMGKKVFRPRQATVKYKDAVYIIANKLYGNDMKLQLETMGISFKNIKKYNTLIE